MNIREFAQEILENAKMSTEASGNDLNTELAQTILDYMIDSGEVMAPEICTFKKTRARITAYDYNDEAESLDLFYFDSAETLVGKVNNNKVQQGFNYLMRFYHESMDGTLLRNAENEDANGEIEEVAELIRSTKGNISQLRIFFLTDGLTDPDAAPAAVESSDDEFIIEYIVWDMQRVYQQQELRSAEKCMIKNIDFGEKMC